MAEAGGGADPGARPGWRWDVALSFAGAQRGYVEQVAKALQARGVRCFYDADEQIDLWGKYLAEELPAIYGEQAATVVVFVSAEYAAGVWTRNERRAALSRAVRERREYVLPARFDDTPLPGLLSDVVTVDLRDRTPEQFAVTIAGKLAALGIAEPEANVQRTAMADAPFMTTAEIEQLARMMLELSGMSDPLSRELFISAVESQFAGRLVVRRETGDLDDTVALIEACLKHPGALHELVYRLQVYHSRGNEERRVMEIVRAVDGGVPPPLLDTDSRNRLYRTLSVLADYITAEMVRSAYREAAGPLSRDPVASHDVASVIRVLESATGDADGLPPLFGFLEELARRLPMVAAAQLRAWVNDLALRHGIPRHLIARLRLSTVPSRNPNFTGREDLLLALRSILSQESATLVPIALTGLSGVGKTQIAIEYVYRFAASYDLICWVSGEYPSHLRTGLAAMAPDLNISMGANLDVTVTAVREALNGGEPYRRWLLVVDNANEPEALMPYLPQAGHVLITSQRRDWAAYQGPGKVVN